MLAITGVQSDICTYKKHKGGFPMKATYNVTGDERKALIGIISDTIGMKPVYMVHAHADLRLCHQ